MTTDSPGLKAASRLDTHEAVCAERYGNLLAMLKSTANRVGRLESLVWVVAGATIVGMAGLIVTLVLKLGHAP
jgi:hypothetical protein